MNFFPDGTLVGVSKRLVWNQFKPPIEIPIIATQPTSQETKHYFQFVCGCGSKFSCFEALDYHVNKKHNGEEPAGTLGGRKSRAAKL